MESTERRQCPTCKKRLDVCRCKKDIIKKNSNKKISVKNNSTKKLSMNKKLQIKPTKVRLFTFNCLTSAFLQGYVEYPEEIHDQSKRHLKIIEIIEKKMTQNFIIALQEVENSLISLLAKLMANNNYIMHNIHNGLKRDNYVGIAICWPSIYKLEDYSQIRVGDAINDKYASGYNKRNKKKDSRNCALKFLDYMRGKKDITDPFIHAVKNWNWILMIKLTDEETDQTFTISTYHMPCLFWNPYALRMHGLSALKLVKKFSGHIDHEDDIFSSKIQNPTFFMGDFGFKPDEKLYIDYSKHFQSAVLSEIGAEPEWTCSVIQKGIEFKGTIDYIWMDKDHEYTIDTSKPKVQGYLPTKDYPSDHLWISAVITW